MTPIEKISVGRCYMTYREVVDTLNEQQATIQFLQNEIDELKKDIDIYKYEEKKHSETARKLYEENEQLQKEIKRLKCMNNQLEKRLDYSIAYDME